MQRPSSYLIFPPYLGLPGRDSSSWRQSQQGPGKAAAHTSLHAAQGTRWQTFLAFDPGLWEASNRLLAWNRPSLPSQSSIPGKPPEDATPSKLKTCRVRSFPHLCHAIVEQILPNVLTSIHSMLCQLQPLPFSSPVRPPPSSLFSLSMACHLLSLSLSPLSNSPGPPFCAFSQSSAAFPTSPTSSTPSSRYLGITLARAGP